MAPIPVAAIAPSATIPAANGTITARTPSVHKIGGYLSNLPLFNILAVSLIVRATTRIIPAPNNKAMAPMPVTAIIPSATIPMANGTITARTPSVHRIGGDFL